VIWLIISRMLAGRSPARGGRDHLHLRLQDLGFSTRQVVLFYYALSLSFGVLGISNAAPSVKLIALILLALIVFAVILYASRRAVAAAR